MASTKTYTLTEVGLWTATAVSSTGAYETSDSSNVVSNFPIAGEITQVILPNGNAYSIRDDRVTTGNGGVGTGDLAAFEMLANKVDNISQESTDTEYPSALSVYNFVRAEIAAALKSKKTK